MRQKAQPFDTLIFWGTDQEKKQTTILSEVTGTAFLILLKETATLRNSS